MKRILILVALGLFLCSEASAFQGGGGQSTKKGSNKNRGNKPAGSVPPAAQRGSRRRQGAGVVSNIRQVDFKNFSYFIEGHTFNLVFKAQMVRLGNGKYEVWDPNHYYRKHYVYLGMIIPSRDYPVFGDDYPVYGDLTNDGRDEAVVLVTSGGDESSIYRQGFIYTVEDGRVKLLTRFGGGQCDCYSGCIDKAKLESGLLVLELGDCDTAEAVRYRLNGDILVQVANQPGRPAAPSVSDSQPVETKTPTLAYKAVYTAVKKRDSEGIKRVLSKGTLEMMETYATMQKKTLNEVIGNGLTETTFSPRLPATRNERIWGYVATLEVRNEKAGSWEALPFVKEDENWKLAIDTFFKGTMAPNGPTNLDYPGQLP